MRILPLRPRCYPAYQPLLPPYLWGDEAHDLQVVCQRRPVLGGQMCNVLQQGPPAGRKRRAGNGGRMLSARA